MTGKLITKCIGAMTGLTFASLLLSDCTQQKRKGFEYSTRYGGFYVEIVYKPNIGRTITIDDNNNKEDGYFSSTTIILEKDTFTLKTMNGLPEDHPIHEYAINQTLLEKVWDAANAERIRKETI
ncbi:hypothetical protein HYT23_01070 [Candidatus Pacearchaeota archaeon]|nr:hypothetical protein [Candidatus Pacearchaeota archaeon]